jgi:hypothetical protein
MSIQINLKLSDKMFAAAKVFAESKGFDSLQDFLREIVREKLFEDGNEKKEGILTYLASERSLAKNWLSKEEEKAWRHLEKEI